MNDFNTEEQRLHIGQLQNILGEIERCSRLTSQHYKDRRNEYITHYCNQVTEMAKSVFISKPGNENNAVVIKN